MHLYSYYIVSIRDKKKKKILVAILLNKPNPKENMRSNGPYKS